MSVYPACVTPFDSQGRVDHAGVARLLAYFRASGCRGVVLAGTAGEGPSLSAVEKRDLVRVAVPLACGLEVILGIATPSLDEAIWLASQAHKAGAQGGLVMPPMYFREATEEGIARWFEALADATPLPLFLYNFPKRTGIALSQSLVSRLASHPNVRGLKDSSGEVSNLPVYRAAMPAGKLFVGDENLLLEAMAAGWDGTISGAANVVPQWLVAVLQDEDPESQATKFELLAPALSALQSADQPALNKALLVRRGILESARVRLPLLDVPQEIVEDADKAVNGKK